LRNEEGAGVKVEPGQVLRATVVAVALDGLRLRAGKVEVHVDVTDVEWYREIDPRDYAPVGAELDVTILRPAAKGRAAAGWLPWPSA
jgi:ribosomal protein S1